ncbi:MAG TPA: SurA N-terminal domain-containing protein [Terracidiphilus sp.]|nr:SurA N-terminal domain-containing protein [Terracidiphilus sp.]
MKDISFAATSRFKTRASLAAAAAAALAAAALFYGFAGCHRSPSADVVATVNGKEILRAELDRNYQSTLGDNPQTPSPQEADIRRLSVLHQMIQEEILDQQAAKLNLTASDEDVNAKLAEIKAPYTDEQFNAMLKQRGQSLDDLKRDIRRGLTETKLMNKEIESKIDITDAQIAAFYAAHKADFNRIEPQYYLAQIVAYIGSPQQSGNVQPAKPSSEADAKRKIDAAYSQLESGEDFATVAMNMSEDPNTASNGGVMGSVGESQLKTDPEVYDAIGKLKPDQFTDVLPIYDQTHKIAGYAIFKLISREPAGQRELNDPRVVQAIHQSLHDGQKQLLQTAYLETLTDSAKVRNFLAEQILKQGGK